MPQLEVQDAPPIAFDGQLAYPTAPRMVVSHCAQEPDGIPFGRFVVRSEAGETRLPQSETDVLERGLGWSIREGSREFRRDGFEVSDAMPVLRWGLLYVRVEAAVTAGNPVFVRFFSGDLGSVSGDATLAGSAAIPNAVFHTSAPAGALAIIEVKNA